MATSPKKVCLEPAPGNCGQVLGLRCELFAPHAGVDHQADAIRWDNADALKHEPWCHAVDHECNCGAAQ